MSLFNQFLAHNNVTMTVTLKKIYFIRIYKNTLVSLSFMHQNLIQLQKVYWKIFIHGYLMYGIFDDHLRGDNCMLLAHRP